MRLVARWFLTLAALLSASNAHADTPASSIAPQDAVVLDPNLMLQISSCAGSSHTDYVWTERVGGHTRFTVAWPGRTHLWYNPGLLPIDAQVYPIMVTTYRAKHTRQVRYSDNHLLLIDDRRSLAKSLRVDEPVHQTPLVADGRLREHRVDLRTVGHDLHNRDPGPEGLVQNLYVGTTVGLETPGTFDLIGIRFESTDKTRPAQDYADASPLTFRVLDPAGKPVADARVSVDAQRLNFARTAITDGQGRATVTPLANEVGQHMVRIEKDGWVTTEFFDVQTKQNDQAVTLMISQAMVLRGRVVDERGVGIPSVAVRMYPGNRTVTSGNGHMLTRTAVATDADGFWQSPPMPIEVETLCLRLTHLDYVSDGYAEIKPGHSVRELLTGNAVAVMRDGMKPHGTLTTASGSPPVAPETHLIVEGFQKPIPGWVNEDGGYDHGTVARGPAQLIVQAPGHAPAVIDLTGDEGDRPLDIRLPASRTLRGRLRDASGTPLKKKRLYVKVDRDGLLFANTGQTSADGGWEWDRTPIHEPLDLYFKHNGETIKVATVQPDEDDVDIQLPAW